jgi:hypothetical protein
MKKYLKIVSDLFSKKKNNDNVYYLFRRSDDESVKNDMDRFMRACENKGLKLPSEKAMHVLEEIFRGKLSSKMK